MPIKSITTTAVGGGGEFKRIYRTSQNIRIINVFRESLLSESFPSLGVIVNFTSLEYAPALISGLVGPAQIPIWSYSYVFLPLMSTAIRASVCYFVGALNDVLYIP